MSKQCPVFRTPIFLLASLFTTSISASAHAAECLSSPNSASTPGTHWYYWTDKKTNQRCWFLKDTAESPGRYAPENTSSGQALSVAPTESESSVKSWFSSSFPALGGSGGWGSSTETREQPPTEGPLTGKRTGNDRVQPNTSQQSKQKNKPEPVGSERAQNESARVQHPSAKITARLLEAAGDKSVPEPRTNLEEWQKTLYEEFLVWRAKQLMFGGAD